jgi:hypothetical protein
VSDVNTAGNTGSPIVPPASGAFDWLRESHQQSVPLAPLTDELPVLAPLRFEYPDPSVPPPGQRIPSPQAFVAAPQGSAPLPPVIAPPQAVMAPPPHVQLAPAPPDVAVVPPVVTSPPAAAVRPLPMSGAASLGLQRRASRRRSASGPLDWIAFVLAIIAPPLGLVMGIITIVVGLRVRGYAVALAKAAVAIAAVLTLALSVAFVVVTKIDHDTAAHDAILASSRPFCAKLRSNPATLASDTFGWPAPADTIPDSVPAMQAYQSYWTALAKIAPSGIEADTERVASAAKSIISSVQSTQTLNDSANIAQMQNVVAASKIPAWDSEYCK